MKKGFRIAGKADLEVGNTVSLLSLSEDCTKDLAARCRDPELRTRRRNSFLYVSCNGTRKLQPLIVSKDFYTEGISRALRRLVVGVEELISVYLYIRESLQDFTRARLFSACDTRWSCSTYRGTKGKIKTVMVGYCDDGFPWRNLLNIQDL